MRTAPATPKQHPLGALLSREASVPPPRPRLQRRRAHSAVEVAAPQQYALNDSLVTGPTGQEQRRHEANVLSQVHHPNVPAFHDAFSERGRYYVVLNYIEGNDLTDIIRSANRRSEVVPLARIMGWILAVC